MNSYKGFQNLDWNTANNFFIVFFFYIFALSERLLITSRFQGKGGSAKCDDLSPCTRGGGVGGFGC